MIRYIALILTVYIFSLLAAPAIGAIYRAVSADDCKKTCKSEDPKKSCDETECSLVFCCLKLQALVQKPFVEIALFRFENEKWETLDEIYIYLWHKDIWQPPEKITTIS
jgi:hypothetical protein